jgi:hypothetical protein
MKDLREVEGKERLKEMRTLKEVRGWKRNGCMLCKRDNGVTKVKVAF